MLNPARAQTHLLAGTAGSGGGFASGAGSLAASQQNLHALLPAYRPAPDFETAVRVKYGDDIAQLLLNPTPPVQQPEQQPTAVAVQPSTKSPQVFFRTHNSIKMSFDILTIIK